MTIRKKIYTAGAITFLIFIVLALMNIWTHQQVLSNLQIRDEVNDKLAGIEEFAKWRNGLIRLISDVAASGHVPPFTDEQLDPPFESPMQEADALVRSAKKLAFLIHEKERVIEEKEKAFAALRVTINDLYYSLDERIATVLAIIQMDQVLGIAAPEKSSLAPYVLKSLNQLTLVALNSLISNNYTEEYKSVVAKNHRFLSSQLQTIDADGGIAALFEDLFAQIESLDTLIPDSNRTLNRFESQIAEAKNHFDRAVGSTEIESIVAQAESEVEMANDVLEKASRRNLITVIIFLAVVPVFVIVFGIIGLNTLIVGPISHLVDEMKNVESGRFDVKAWAKTNDEITELAWAFNTMASEIKAKVTEMALLNQTLKASESKYRMLVDNLPQRIFHKNKNLAYVSCSRNFARDLGIREEDIVGKTDFDLFPETVAEKYRTDDTRVLLTETPEEIEETYVQNGKELIVMTVKTPIRDEKGDVSGVLGIFWDITERKRAEKELHLARFSLENASVEIFWIDAEGLLQYVNESACKNLGYRRNEILSMRIWDIDPDFSSERYAQLWRDMSDGEPVVLESTQHRKDGSVFPVEIFVRQGEFKGVRLNFAFISDITARKEMESQLVQAQKMESVGRLAGGVAHDFNNMLGIILGNTEMILEDMDADHPFIAKLLEIRAATERSTNLTRQLLAFARKQITAPKVLDINDTLEAMLKMLQQLIGEGIDLVWLPAEDLRSVKIDPSQVDQIVVNLCINARDAINGVGKITIETDNVNIDEAYCRDHAGFKPGKYIMIAVSDNGCGMDRETLNNLFEPFFTTKDVGEGSGLGLATVYGIVKQNRGFINVYSEANEGTTFKIYLLQHSDKSVKEQQTTSASSATNGHETILLVEDEKSILKMTTEMLERLGYTVLAASMPGEAIRMVEAYSDEINMIITDVVMPEMSGRDLAEHLLHLYPNLKCLFMSGYTADVIAHHGVLDEGIQFINKPFAIQDLAGKVRKVLDVAEASTQGR